MIKLLFYAEFQKIIILKGTALGRNPTISIPYNGIMQIYM